MFHVDSAINRGNSGGPCFNAYAEAIGTNTWGFGSLENWGFSVPTDMLKKSAADIIAYGRVRRPWVGISLHSEIGGGDEMYMQGVTQGLWFDPRPKDLEVKVVNPYSPAYEAGLREGDIIKYIDGERIDYIFDIYLYFLNAELGQEIEFKIRRGKGKPMSIVVEVGEKEVRYFGTDIEAGGRYSVQTYHSPITY
jgi:serine protease Do